MVCVGTTTGGHTMARGTGDGYPLHFNEELDVHDFTSSIASTSVGSRPPHSIHSDATDDDDAGIAYQLMDDNSDSGQ